MFFNNKILNINSFLKEGWFRKRFQYTPTKLLKYLFNNCPNPITVNGTGVIESNKNYGFIRFLENGFRNSILDIYVKPQILKKFNLQQHSVITFTAVVHKGIFKSININSYNLAKNFYDCIAIQPKEQINFNANLESKIISFITPMAHGQRTMIVAPPKSGKTTILNKIMESCVELLKTDKDLEIYVLLCAEGVEEATDFFRASNKVDVIYTTFDNNPEIQVKTCEMAMEYFKARAMIGKKCIVLIDSLTRMVRSYNAMPTNNSSKTLSGGIEYSSLLFGKKAFGAARNLEGKGSITIIATCLIDTNSKGDEVIYEEFKGTSNCDIFLSRKLIEDNIFPPLDCKRSSTRNEHLILGVEAARICNTIKREFINNNDCQTIMMLNKIIESAPQDKNLASILVEKIGSNN